MSLKLIYDYKDITDYRLSFNQLANNTFGIDFEKWYQHRFWNDRYICYSYLDGDKVVANVSVNKMDLIIEGERKTALQLGTVMTHPEYRNRGLIANLMDSILQEYETKYDLIYLFANESVLNFYPKFGFKRINESEFSLDIKIDQPSYGNIRKLDIFNSTDASIITRLASTRVPISRVFGIENAQNLLAWYCINVFQEDVYYLEDEDIIIIYKAEEGNLHLYDVISTNRIMLHNILHRIPSKETNKVIFYFTPDFEDRGITYSSKLSTEICFVRSASSNISTNFKYPLTAQA